MDDGNSKMNASADLVRTLIAGLFKSLADDTRRAQGLLRDALPQVVSNFQGLQNQVTEHVKMVEDLGRQLQGAGSEPGFISRMKVIIDTFVGDLVSVSQQSVRVVERVTFMGREVDSVTNNARRIEKMADTTRFIALNAHIEAHKSGDAGRTFRVVAEEVKQLAGDAQDFSRQIRDAIERCKLRLNETREMVGSLASHDMTVALRAQQGLIDTVKSIDDSNRALIITLRDLDGRVRESIRALQFDDILMQLLGSIGMRIEKLEAVWLESLPPQFSDEDAARLVKAFERHRGELEARQVVTQTSVEEGTIELF